MVTMRQYTPEFRQSAVNLVLVEGNYCVGRIDEREDQENQVAGLRFTQSSTLPRCDHVSLGRTRFISTNRINQPGFLKRH